MTDWTFRLRGGPWDGTVVQVENVPAQVAMEWPPANVYMYKCENAPCPGHMQFDLSLCPLHTVLVYNREDVDYDEDIVTYVLADTELYEDGAQREFALAGAGSAPIDPLTVFVP